SSPACDVGVHRVENHLEVVADRGGRASRVSGSEGCRDVDVFGQGSVQPARVEDELEPRASDMPLETVDVLLHGGVAAETSHQAVEFSVETGVAQQITLVDR